MYKVTAIFFSIFLISISLAGLRAPSGELGMFLTINETQAAGRLGLAALLLLSLFTTGTLMKILLGSVAAGLMAITVSGLAGGGIYMLPIDLFVALEGIVLFWLGSLRPVTPSQGWTRIKSGSTAIASFRHQKITQP